MSSTYDTDIVIWSEQQSELLRLIAAGDVPNVAPDWLNIIEEVETLGRSELHTCESQIRQALVHLLKMRAWPGSKATAHRRAELRGFLFEAGRSFTPSMRQRIELAKIYRSAVEQVRDETDESSAPKILPDSCPWTLEALLAGDLGALC